MDKEREIEEMAQAQGNYCKNNKRSCKECIIKDGEECRSYITALILYEKGIRVADAVRKETAKEFKQTMKDIFRFVLRNKGNTSIPYFNAEELVFAKFDKEVDREFLQEYGVKVDE